jgi:hypothetical protein
VALSAWPEPNGAVIEDFLDERYQNAITTEEGRKEVGLECTSQFPEGPLSSTPALRWPS